MPARDRQPLPQGYRQGIITAITVFLAFSLAFLRFWSLEASGAWHGGAVVSAAALAGGVGLHLVALFRALDVRDDDEPRYARTVQIFALGVVAVMAGVALSAFVAT
jgi:hypothetical protein